MSGALVFAGLRGCTPGYYNREGEMDMITDPAMQMKAMKNAVWPSGFTSYCETLEQWREQGDMKGLDVTYV
jgi:hypothetical protein